MPRSNWPWRSRPRLGERAERDIPTGLVQLFDSYLVYEAADGLVFVDQHSAHERVLYEAAMERLTGGGADPSACSCPSRSS